MTALDERVIVLPRANSGLPLKGDFERMAKRRFQNPRPFREGAWWWIFVRRDVFSLGKPSRRKERVKLAPATMPEREVRKVAAEHLRPLNQGLESLGSATNFATYVNDTYIPVVLPLMATTTQSRSRGVIQNYLLPAFGNACLRDLGTLQLQRYFSGMTGAGCRTNRRTRSVTCSPACLAQRCATNSSSRTRWRVCSFLRARLARESGSRTSPQHSSTSL